MYFKNHGNSINTTFILEPMSGSSGIVSGLTWTPNILTINSGESSISTEINSFSALTISGPLTISANTTISGDILPSSTLNYNLGSSDYRWDNLWANEVNIGSGTTRLIDDGNNFSISGNNGNFIFIPSNNFEVRSDIISDANLTRNLGAVDNKWANVFVGNVVSDNFSATTISDVDYINFNTEGGITPISGGTLFFKNDVNALSYNPITPNNDVTVNIGQESMVYVYNGTSNTILNGQICIVTGSTSGTPSVTLAIASGGTNDLFNADGVATHNIGVGDFGFITNFGRVHDVDTTGFSVGDNLYLSDTVFGAFSTVDDVFITSRTAEVGRVISNGLSGTVFVNIYRENDITNITLKESNILSVNNASTGVFTFSGLSVSSPTTFDVGRVEGWIVNNETNPTFPSIEYIDFSGTTGVTTPFLSSSTESYVSLTPSLTISISPTKPEPSDRRLNIYLGKVNHSDKVNITDVFDEPDFIISPISQVRDMFAPINLINGGVIPSPNGTNLSYNTSFGVLYGFGIGFTTDRTNPNTLDIPANVPTTFKYRTQTGGTFSDTTLIDPTNYDLNGTVTAVGGGVNRSTNQRIYLLQSGEFRVQYGQQVYDNLSVAISAAQTESFTTFQNHISVGILVGILSVSRSATDLSSTSQARFLTISKFGERIGAAAGISVSTLQQAYNNSVTPEILTNSTLGALTIKRGSASDSDNIIEGQNGTGDTTSYITGSGNAKFVNLSGDTIYSGGTNLSDIFLTSHGDFLPLSGGTLTGGLSGTSISATTLYASNNLGIGPSPDPSIRLDVRAEGASSDIEFRIRNSGGTGNIFNISGDYVVQSRRSNNTEDTLRVDGTNNYVEMFKTDAVQHRGIRFSKNASNLNSMEYFTQNASVNGHFLFKSTPSSGGYGTSASGFVFQSGNESTAGFTISPRNIALSNETPSTLQTVTLGKNVFHIQNNTIPTTSLIDHFAIYSADIVAGNAAPHFRTEAGNIIKLYTTSAVTTTQGISDALTSLGLLSASTISASALNELSDVTISTGATGGSSIEYVASGSTWVDVPIKWTIELIDAQTVDVYAPYALAINSIDNILNTPSIALFDDDVVYTTGSTIAIGSKITISADTASVVNLIISK
jgi:hypothetical protein